MGVKLLSWHDKSAFFVNKEQQWRKLHWIEKNGKISERNEKYHLQQKDIVGW